MIINIRKNIIICHIDDPRSGEHQNVKIIMAKEDQEKLYQSLINSDYDGLAGERLNEILNHPAIITEVLTYLKKLNILYEIEYCVEEPSILA